MKIIAFLILCVVVYYAAMFIFYFKTRGCLYGKSDKYKDEYFASLYHFSTTDKEFFQEQYWDLLPKEREEFVSWLEIKKIVNLIEELLCQKDKE